MGENTAQASDSPTELFSASPSQALDACPGGQVSDWASGGTRHAVWRAVRAHRITAVARDLVVSAAVREIPGVTWVEHDRDRSWTIEPAVSQGVVVDDLYEPPFNAWHRGALLGNLRCVIGAMTSRASRNTYSSRESCSKGSAGGSAEWPSRP